MFMEFMKLGHSYTNLYLAQLFCCSASSQQCNTITFIHVIHKLFFISIMATVTSQEKNQRYLSASFQRSSKNWRMVIDCTDIEVATPGQMDLQMQTYSVYRSMRSFKLLLGIAPNSVITYCSDLYSGPVSDKAIVQKSGFEKIFTSGDMILAYKGFLIQSLMPAGVTVNIPPFLNPGQVNRDGSHSQKTYRETGSMLRWQMLNENISKS